LRRETTIIENDIVGGLVMKLIEEAVKQRSVSKSHLRWSIALRDASYIKVHLNKRWA